MDLIVGTYTRPIAGMAGNGAGIYRVPFDGGTGAFGPPDLLADCVNPSSLVLSPCGVVLMAGREVFADHGPAVVSFRVSADGGLTPLSHMPLDGQLPCHLAFDPAQRRLASAQYWTGDVAICPVAAGVLQPPRYLRRTGRGPNAARQEGPHAHCVAFSDGGEVLHLADLGTDSLVSHRLAPDGRAVETAELRLPAGSGPRHIALNRAATRAWVVCELDETLALLERAGLGWTLSRVRPGFEVPRGTDGAAAAIRLSHDARHVYISGRRQSSIAAFSGDGQLIGRFDTGGQGPREFIVTPDDGWIVVANQTSDTLTSLRREAATGRLALTDNACAIGSPASIVVDDRRDRRAAPSRR
ncbi:lactonase family protein [Psychromarinibacter sp. C21-152]|uniref:Lactonase family protein n=1 Tax=Psychromarinibacter sediminicola TaxID=3033385 RepID=A0AAE3T707_9RHOB|nr:lactonase family protein [Psychromarinibacter sediminicola]MDF0599827.1 lactonase family protein [Psychromarinibacter sediminicola]